MDERFQEQVARLRRKQILDAAIKLFAEQGFHRTTIRDVANAAGVADGTIYNHFANKTALLLGILDPLNDADASPAEMPTMRDIRPFFREHFANRLLIFEGNKLDVMRVVLSEVLTHPELRALYVDRVLTPPIRMAEPLFQSFVASGELRPMDVPLTLRIVTATFLGLVTMRLMGDSHICDRWNDIPELLTDLLLDGLLPNEGNPHDAL